jgi:hypothetical protein
MFIAQTAREKVFRSRGAQCAVQRTEYLAPLERRGSRGTISINISSLRDEDGRNRRSSFGLGLGFAQDEGFFLPFLVSCDKLR